MRFPLSPFRMAAPLIMAGTRDLTSSLISYSSHPCFNDEIIDMYDAFILDQFGVMHNGVRALDGAIDLVEYLVQKKKRLIILSNTSSPSEKALLKLPKLGFDRNLFIGAVTSGEEASKHIRQTYGGSSRALMFTWDTSDVNNPRLTSMPQAFLDHCGGLQVASTVEEADFLLLHGSEVWYRGKENEPLSLGSFLKDGSMDETIDPILKQCLERNLPLVCANPDIIVQTPSGGTNFMPGKIAQRYIEMGQSNVLLFGKPQPEHFQACIKALDLPPGRVAHVGDSLHHDIAGANAAGIPSIFITSGIHSSQLKTSFGQLPDRDLLEKLMVEEGGHLPVHVVPAFRR